MGMFRRSDPEAALQQSAETMAKKVDPEGTISGWLGSMANEIAAARPNYTDVSASRATMQEQSRYVAEVAEGNLEHRSGSHGRDRRSAQADRQGWAPSGIFGARQRDVHGQIPYERWPEHTVAHVEQPKYDPYPYLPVPGSNSSGCTCGHC